MGAVISVTNQKGGVGKTLTASSLASILTDKGYKVLSIDMDPQSNFTAVAGGPGTIKLGDTTSLSILDVLKQECSIEEAIVKSDIGDLVRASPNLTQWTGRTLMSRRNFQELQGQGATPEEVYNLLEQRFREGWGAVEHTTLDWALRKVRGEYDFIFLDTNPSLTLLTLNSLYTADYIIIPVFTEDTSRTALLDLNGPWAVVAVESLLFLASLTVFYRLALPKYNYVLQHMEGAPAHWNRFIVAENCLWLLLLYTMHLSFLDTEGKVVHLLAVLLLLTVIYVSYFILYRALLDTDRMVQLEKAALEDPLTRLGNRACLWQDLDAMLGEQKLFSVVFMDLDRFKQINDQYGHMVGDAYLQHFARISAEILAPRGRVYRFGGDEFVAVWPGVIPAAILQEIKACSRWDEGAPCPFNQVSIGVLHCRPPHRGAEKILQQVDQLMYRNKLKKQSGSAQG